MLVKLNTPVEPPQQLPNDDLGQKLLVAFLTGIATAAGAAFFNAVTQPKRRRR